MRVPDLRRRCLPRGEWPVAVRTAWDAAMARRTGRFSRRGRTGRLASASITKAEQGVGRYLGFLHWVGDDMGGTDPADLVTPERADRYFEELQALGNADHTIVGRFDELASGLSIMVPGVDLRWLRRPGGLSLRTLLPMRKRHFTVRHSRELRDWGLDLMRAALDLPGPCRRRVQLRDGLLIALLATRGPRLRSVTILRLGRHVVQDEAGRWSIALNEEDIKTGRPIAYPFPRSLQPWVKRYIEIERQELLAGKAHDAFWVNWGGDALGKRGLEKRVRWWSEKRYGKGEVFGPHRCRHGIGTTGPAVDPAGLGGAPEMLGISARTHEKSYNRGRGFEAAARFHEALRKERIGE